MTPKKILIIDDDARNIFALSATLTAKGYQCTTAISAIDAFELLNKEKDIGIILIDMMMPDLDGYAAIPILKQSLHSAGITIVAITAQAMQGDKEKCLAAGADEYISKPVDVDVLLNYLNKYLGV